MPSRNKLNPMLKLTVTSGLMALLLAGCGIRGGLKVPPPVFGASQTDPDQVPVKDLDSEDEIDSDDPLDRDFTNVDENRSSSDSFESNLQ